MDSKRITWIPTESQENAIIYRMVAFLFQSCKSSGVSKQTVEFKGKKVDIQNSGVGTIHITMECTSLKARNSGVGKLILSGTADQTEINSNGVNKIDATELNKF